MGNRRYPDNRDGQHTSWHGPTVQQFWREYMTPYDDRVWRDNNIILHCPTQKWHRLRHDPELTGGLIGYFFLRHRREDSLDYTPAGVKWVTRTRMGQLSHAPILMDMIQSDWNGADDVWFDDQSGMPFSSHATRQTFEPNGANYLFESGGVFWHEREEVRLGAQIPSNDWRMYYRIPGTD